MGVRGAHVTFGRNGVTRTVGIPGTGLYYTSRSGRHTGFHSAHTETEVDDATRQRADRAAGFILFAVLIAIALLIGIAIGSVASHG